MQGEKKIIDAHYWLQNTLLENICTRFKGLREARQDAPIT